MKARRWGTVAAVAVIAFSAVGIGFQGVYLAADNAYLQSQIAPSLTARTAEALRAVRAQPAQPRIQERGRPRLFRRDSGL